MRLVILLLTLTISCGATLAIGLYAGVKRVWPVPQLRLLLATEGQPLVRTDRFGRLLSYPGKIEITCPIQDEKTPSCCLSANQTPAIIRGSVIKALTTGLLIFRMDGVIVPPLHCLALTARKGKPGPCSATSLFNQGSTVPSF